MEKLHREKPLLFALLWIILYVIVTSFCEGVGKWLTLLWHAALSVFLLFFLQKGGHFSFYGLCAPKYPAKRFAFYLPLILLCSSNLWFGVRMNMPLPETLFYLGSMLCVGFLEELIFRGFLFRAMERDGIRSAIIVSSLTFGIGHLVNLINGSGMELIENICQVVSAVAFGFLFVVMFHRGRSLLPCIIAHSTINMLSAFSAEGEGVLIDIAVSAVLTIGTLCYTFFLIKMLPEKEENIT